VSDHAIGEIMKTLTFPTFLIVMAISLSTARAATPQIGAQAALRTLPAHFANHVVKLTADNGRPNPRRWYVLARNPQARRLLIKDPLYSITIVGGHIAEAKRSLDARQIFERRIIDLSKVRIDSGEAFEIARNALGRRGEKMRSASYQLTQRGPAADPVWEVWAYGKRDFYLGVVRLSATTGDIISSRKSWLPSF
jgi:hypothetical protein